MNWTEAENFCSQNGMNLITLKAKEQIKKLQGANPLKAISELKNRLTKIYILDFKLQL